MRVTIEVTDEEIDALDTCIWIATPDDEDPKEVVLARRILFRLRVAYNTEEDLQRAQPQE